MQAPRARTRRFLSKVKHTDFAMRPARCRGPARRPVAAECVIRLELAGQVLESSTTRRSLNRLKTVLKLSPLPSSPRR